jgi:hypothetical protein
MKMKRGKWEGFGKKQFLLLTVTDFTIGFSQVLSHFYVAIASTYYLLLYSCQPAKGPGAQQKQSSSASIITSKSLCALKFNKLKPAVQSTDSLTFFCCQGLFAIIFFSSAENSAGWEKKESLALKLE